MEKDKVVIIDNIKEGHHKFYSSLLIESVLSLKNIKLHFIGYLIDEYKDEVNFEKISYNKVSERIRGLVNRIKWIIQVFKKLNNINPRLVHFAYLDNLLALSPLLILYLLRYNNIRFTATLHHFPHKKLKIIFLKLLSIFFDTVVVHGNYIKSKAKHYGMNNFYSVEYPAMSNNFTDKELARKKLNLAKDAVIILAMGETRYSKGLDLLLEVLKDIKHLKFQLVIAGSAKDFSKKYIHKKVETFKNKVVTDINYISDNKFNLYFDAGDVVVLPYRKQFTGQSGPLIEGVNHNCIILSASHGQIGSTTSTYELGEVFQSENKDDLIKKLRYIIENISKFQRTQKYLKFKENISSYSFKKNYRDIFKYYTK